MTVPGRLKTVPRRLTHQVGRRGVVLLWLALVDLVYALTFARPTPAILASPTFRFFGGLFAPFLTVEQGLLAWAALWGLVGLACLVFAFRLKDWPAYAAAMALKFFWTLSVLLAWLFLGLDRGYLSVAIWGFFTVVVAVHINWRENWERVA